LPTYCTVSISRKSPGDLLQMRQNASEVPNESRSQRNRAKAFECLSLAEGMNDPKRRIEILRYARWWMQLAEPAGTSRGAYDVAIHQSVSPDYRAAAL
jgi:hypothetical protein